MDRGRAPPPPTAKLQQKRPPLPARDDSKYVAPVLPVLPVLPPRDIDEGELRDSDHKKEEEEEEEKKHHHEKKEKKEKKKEKSKERVHEERTLVFDEFIATEKHYIDVLKRIGPHFKEPLEDVLTVKVDRLVFGLFPTLSKVHDALLSNLEHVRENWTMDSLIGDLLHDWIPTMSPYNNYALNVGKAQSTLQSLYHSNSYFVDIVDQCHFNSVYSKFRGLNSLLVTPIQRVMRYVILTQSLLKKTPPSHPDHDGLARSLQAFGVFVDHVNKVKLQADQKTMVENLESRLTGDLSVLVQSTPNLNQELEHKFSKSSDLNLVRCDSCGHTILKEPLCCVCCNMQIHETCLDLLQETNCDIAFRPKLLGNQRTFINNWDKVTFRALSSKIGAEFGDQVRHSMDICSIYLFSDCLLVVIKSKNDFKLLCAVKFYSHSLNAWASVSSVTGKEEDKFLFLAKITPPNPKLDVCSLRFGNVDEGKEFDTQIKEAITEKKRIQIARASVLGSFAKSDTQSPREKGEEKNEEIRDFPKPKQYFKFSIVDTVPVSCGSSKGVYTAYCISAERVDGQKFDFLKRFRQFFDLNNKLCKVYGEKKVLAAARMPSKKYNKTNPVVIQKRCQKLEQYLNGLDNLPDVWGQACVLRFLSTNVEDYDSDDSDDESKSRPLGSLTFPAPSRRNRSFRHTFFEKKKKKEKEEEEMRKSMDIMPPPILTVKALFDFEGEKGELSFKKGDELAILNSDGKEWWTAALNGQCGRIPRSYTSAATPGHPVP